MNILYLSTSAVLGGAEMVLLDILASLRAAYPSWNLNLILGEDGPLHAEAERLGASCTLLPLPGSAARLGDAGRKGPASRLALAAAAPATAAYVARLRAALRARQPDVVHTNGMKAHLLAAWAAPPRLPLVWHLHDYLGSRALMVRLLRLAARARRPGTLQGVAVSRSVAADASDVLGPRVPIHTVLNAVDLTRFTPGPGDGEALDHAAGLLPAPPGTLRVGLLATFAIWKGQDVFLEAAARLPAHLPCRFYIIGGPIYRSLGSQWTLDELRDRARTLGLDGRVGFTGFREPAEALRALDIVVHASTRPEPFGRVIVEGMACGRPVIAARNGGAAELFNDGVEALGVEPANPDALADAIRQLASNSHLRNQLALAGRHAAETRYDRLALAQTWASLYTRAADKTPPTNTTSPVR